MQAVVLRSKTSIDRFGSNVDVFWAHDGRGLIVLVSKTWNYSYLGESY